MLSSSVTVWHWNQQGPARPDSQTALLKGLLPWGSGVGEVWSSLCGLELPASARSLPSPAPPARWVLAGCPLLGILPHQSLGGPWPGSAILESPQQLSPLPPLPEDAPLEGRKEGPPSTFQRQPALEISASPPTLHILNRAAWLQPLPPGLHGNRAAFQVQV